MNHLLWKCYHEDDVEKFRRLLAPASHNTPHKNNGSGAGYGSVGSYGTSPKTAMKNRKASGNFGSAGVAKSGNISLGKAEVNSRDHAGLTVLHRAASSTSENAVSFALALLDHPSIDLYIQDPENGWTALHRALYFGNISIARAILEKSRQDPRINIIKIKDHEGNGAFDVYNATIARRALQQESLNSDNDSDDSESLADVTGTGQDSGQLSVEGDELFVFGSNKNHSLGVRDGDDRQYPEKINLQRPDHLLFRFYREYLEKTKSEGLETESKSVPKSLAELPRLILDRPVIIHDVALSKLHSAVITTDPEANLYMCGFGPGGRLGTGDEVTRFTYTCIEEGGLAGKKIMTVALGQNHTLAVSSEGEIFSWGTSSFGQLGYALPRPALQDEEPICTTPRQIFGPLKREIIIGVAASAIHSVAHTSTSLYCWGKNEGQLGLMDSDSRSLAVQPVPRKVAATLFKAPIQMVSAINGATICLLANHTVCVFTGYGYNMVKFPLDVEFSNYHLGAALTTRYGNGSNHICSITAGGDTIAAVSSRGDLFTVGVRKLDSDGSTTNPSKIKSALSTPQRIWSLRKGQWDGIKSVGVAENGSVIVCTNAGAVWRRVKRAKIKNAFAYSANFTQKDFKFQRVPGLTKVTVVRSTTYGVYAAIRKDCDVTKQVSVQPQSLWEDVEPLLSIRGISLAQGTGVPSSLAKIFNHYKLAILSSPDIESAMADHLAGEDLKDYDVEICSSTSEVGVPVHGFMLAGRSSVLRKAISTFYQTGSSNVSEVLVIESIESSAPGSGPAVRITFQGLDFISLLNLVIYVYTDTLVDVWDFTRVHPNMAFRFRQTRVELMKLATHLKMLRLEPAVRLMRASEKCLNLDMSLALQDPAFFSNHDTIIDLDKSEIFAHSAMLSQRCPFFEGLFHGRAGGQWLAGRRESKSDVVHVDLKHIQPVTIGFVMRYLYADVGTELFDDLISGDIDDFSEVVMDVMNVADELMLDRLSQICQEVIGRFVNTRNVSQLVNLISPCSVSDFKDAALEYICLQLEAMLENHWLDDLDDDLLLELDEVVRENQLNCLPYAKSGRAELLLHERNPDLAENIDRERQRRIRDMTFRTHLKEEESRLSSSSKARIGSLDDTFFGSPMHDKSRRKSKTSINAPFSPSIRAKDSTVDLMFDMEDDDPLTPASPSPKAIDSGMSRSRNVSSDWNELDKPDYEPSSGPSGEFQERSKEQTKTWSSPALGSSKLDMREIMERQASSSRVSSLSLSLSAQNVKDQKESNAARPKPSQKERKKQQQLALQQSISQPSIVLETPPGDKSSSPWQVATPGPKTSLKDILKDPSPLALTPKSPISPVPSRPLTPRRTASPDTRFAGQQRSGSHSNKRQSSAPSASQPKSQSNSNPYLVPHCRSYTTPATQPEPALQLSMTDIIGQQRREQELIKEAVAKRSLQEIQEEQAFQEWWDQEAQRVQSGEAAAAASATGRGKSGRGSGRGQARGRGRGRGGSFAGKGRGGSAAEP